MKITEPLVAKCSARRIEAISQRLHIPFVSETNLLKEGDFIPREYNWNRQGHERLAAIIAELYDRDPR
jgi:hypothetical protein